MRAPLIAALFCSTLPAGAMFAEVPIPQVPVQRLVRNLEAKLSENPSDVETRFQQARVHYLAFALRQVYLEQTYHSLVPLPPHDNDETYRHIRPPRYLVPRHRARFVAPWRMRLTLEEELWHAHMAAWLFNQVLSVQPSHALAHLGLGSLLEQFDRRASRYRGFSIPSLLQQRDARMLRAHYEQAFRIAWREDHQHPPGGFYPAVSEQAADAYTRSAKRAPQLTRHEVETLRDMAAAQAFFLNLPKRVTPLIWRDGFDALAALDDNRDGWLTQRELDGLSVWFDRDGDATSDAGEVTPLVKLGVRALAVRHQDHDGRHPVHRRGVLFSDGRALPLWDWLAEPLPLP